MAAAEGHAGPWAGVRWWLLPVTLGYNGALWYLLVTPLPERVRHLSEATFSFTHLLTFAGLTVLWWLTLGNRRPRLLWFACLPQAVASELVQGLLPWRFFQWSDIVANMAGVLLVALAAAAFRRYRGGRRFLSERAT